LRHSRVANDEGTAMRRRLWIVPLAAIVLLAAAHFALWRTEAAQLQAGFAAWLAERRAAGWTAQAGGEELGGWPLAATLSVAGVSLQGGEPDIPGGMAWSTERLELRIDLWSPGALELRASGAQHLRVAGLPDIPYTADAMTALLPLAADTPPHAASLTVRDLRAGLPMWGPSAAVTVGLVQADVAIKPDAPAGEAALTYHIGTEAIALPAVRSWPLGDRISSLSSDGAIDGPVPLARGLVPRATAWRDGGGTFEVRDFAMGWGPLGMSGAATIALDAHLQPMGTGRLRLVGYAEALDALTGGHVLTSGTAVAIKAVLSLLATTPPGGGPAEVAVPLTLQNRTLSMRQVPLLRLPEIIWPER
jgi:hypothetical protein